MITKKKIIFNSLGDKIYLHSVVEGYRKTIYSFRAETTDGKFFNGSLCQCKGFLNEYRMFKERNWKTEWVEIPKNIE